jgi:hypothetical protein
VSVEATTAAWAWPGLSPTEKLVLVRIGDHAAPDGTNAWPSNSRLQRDTGLSERAIRGALRSLEQKGALTVDVAAGPRGTNRYSVTLTPPAGDAPRQEMPPAPAAPPRQEMPPTPAGDAGDPGTTCPPPRQEVPPNRKEPSRTTNTPTSTSTPPAPPARDPFDRFWTAWPRKVGKRAARKAWAAALKRSATPDEIITAASDQATAWAAAGTELRFIPHPATWLGRDGWDDEAPLATPAPAGPAQPAGRRIEPYVPDGTDGDPDLNLAGIGAARAGLTNAGAA